MSFELKEITFFLAIILGLITFVLTIAGTLMVRKLALQWKVVDDPRSNPQRKFQKQPIPLLGGVAFSLVSLLFTGLTWLIVKGFLGADYVELQFNLIHNLEEFKIVWVFIGAIVILIGGIVDDILQLSPRWILLFTGIAITTVVTLGNVEIEVLSGPLRNIIPDLDIIHRLIAFVWIGVCVVSMKILDGHDGLVSGVGIIGLGSIAATALISYINQPFIFVFAFVWMCGIAGFLPFNLPDAKMYLGESGAQIIGFMIGVLSVISGAKIATAASVLGWFAIDFLIVLYYRHQRKQRLLVGDRTHLHLRLTDRGWNKWQTLGLLCGISLLGAGVGVFLPAEVKLLFILIQTLFIFFLVILVPIRKL